MSEERSLLSSKWLSVAIVAGVVAMNVTAWGIPALSSAMLPQKVDHQPPSPNLPWLRARDQASARAPQQPRILETVTAKGSPAVAPDQSQSLRSMQALRPAQTATFRLQGKKSKMDRPVVSLYAPGVRIRTGALPRRAKPAARGLKTHLDGKQSREKPRITSHVRTGGVGRKTSRLLVVDIINSQAGDVASKRRSRRGTTRSRARQTRVRWQFAPVQFSQSQLANRDRGSARSSNSGKRMALLHGQIPPLPVSLVRRPVRIKTAIKSKTTSRSASRATKVRVAADHRAQGPKRVGTKNDQRRRVKRRRLAQVGGWIARKKRRANRSRRIEGFRPSFYKILKDSNFWGTGR